MITGKKIVKNQDSLIIPAKTQKPPIKVSEQYKITKKLEENPVPESKVITNDAIEKVAKGLKQKTGQQNKQRNRGYIQKQSKQIKETSKRQKNKQPSEKTLQQPQIVIEEEISRDKAEKIQCLSEDLMSSIKDDQLCGQQNFISFNEYEQPSSPQPINQKTPFFQDSREQEEQMPPMPTPKQFFTTYVPAFPIEFETLPQKIDQKREENNQNEENAGTIDSKDQILTQGLEMLGLNMDIFSLKVDEILDKEYFQV